MSAGCLDPVMRSEDMVGPYVVFAVVAPLTVRWPQPEQGGLPATSPSPACS
jgi:hypothetical protein